MGPYNTVGSAYETLTGWIHSHGLALVGPPREVYLSPPDAAPELTQTIVEFPIGDTGQVDLA
jgi:effector-binding domain-containing protein